MNPRDFHNALRIVHCLGLTDLQSAGVVDENWGTPEASNRDQIAAFFDDRFTEILRMPDANFDRLCKLIESRQPSRRAA
ncbi:hypothetical protein NA8A_18277 [Nitratireductor indicus C115]|uniref:Uncharacterized protein n=1 Tax=Nitratireductor indicus C115 TaxID=1231190 RepID=K2NN66_9HYPH|nr:hypothetical protein [Nitratireductor indicus]EKF40865.1 hypothetical protein NA8A_18277 [Nitratireductor indicus C115]SFQ33512.1 hypothetical protein SAMN05216176_102638 [Nitratireductor indicus]